MKLVSHAEKFVTGLVTNGILLEGLVEDLKKASLDYMQVTVESSDPKIHDKMAGVENALSQVEAGIQEAVSRGMNVVTNTTLTKDNIDTFLDTIKWCHGLGITSVACNTLICSGRGIKYRDQNGVSLEKVRETLVSAANLTHYLKMELQWYSPTCYNDLDPIDLRLGVKSCSAAQHNMTIQPDGSILPCQSWPESVGNILTDKWQDIWNHPICQKLRKHEFAPHECDTCNKFSLCGGGCPLDHRKG